MKNELESIIAPTFKAVINAPWEQKAFYAQYLSQTYYYTFHSCRLLAFAAAHTKSHQNEYYKRSVAHIAEEAGHDNLALLDLKRIGSKIEDYPELPTTKAFWQPQYFLTEQSTTALLGYILALEWLAVETFPHVLPKTKSLYGDKCTNFIRVHAEDDPDHIDKCFEQIAKVSAEEKKIILENFKQTCRMFELFVQECTLKAA